MLVRFDIPDMPYRLCTVTARSGLLLPVTCWFPALNLPPVRAARPVLRAARAPLRGKRVSPVMPYPADASLDAEWGFAPLSRYSGA